MNSFMYIAADEHGPASGGGPDDDTGFQNRMLRSRGFIAIAFGFALGLTFMIFFGLFHSMETPPFGLKAWVEIVHPNLWFTFLFGFLFGTLISAIYNYLIFQ